MRIANLANIKWEGVPDFGATILKARSLNLSLDRGKNKSKFDADLRTVGRVESVKIATVLFCIHSLSLCLSVLCVFVYCVYEFHNNN